MKLLERLFDPDDKPVSVGSALVFERPAWLVSCVTKHRESFGLVSSETHYEIVADTEEEARKSVRSFIRRTKPDCVIDSVRAERR